MHKAKMSVNLRLRGGLGNQLYGLAAGWVIASTTRLPLILDGRYIPWEGSNPNRSLELDRFAWAGNPTITFRRTIQTGATNRYLRLLVSKIKELTIPKSRLENANVGDTIEALEPLKQRALQGKSLQGYFQDFRWVELAFKFGMPTQLELTTPTTAALNYSKLVSKQVAVHIWLGDFLDFPGTFIIPSENYYLRSIEYLRKQAADDQLEYWVFTENENETFERFPAIIQGAAKVVTAADLSGPESLALMSKFNNIVTSNSSFSTWAGLFSSARGGVVTCPENRHQDAPDRRPEAWVRIR